MYCTVHQTRLMRGTVIYICAGHTFLTAAGNDGASLAISPVYPAALRLPNILNHRTLTETDLHTRAGHLFVTAAGNDGLNLAASPVYPAALRLPNMLTVAATTSTDFLADFSNYWK